MTKRIVGDDVARFWSKVEKTDGCWLWTGAKTQWGYGNFYLAGRYLAAHRVAFEWAKGPVPTDRELDHLCRVRHCVRPDHLEAVTHRENDIRGVGVAATNVVKTHCDAGHLYDEANTYYRPDGGGHNGVRDCRRCRADSAARRRAKKRAGV